MTVIRPRSPPVSFPRTGINSVGVVQGPPSGVPTWAQGLAVGAWKELPNTAYNTHIANTPIYNYKDATTLYGTAFGTYVPVSKSVRELTAASQFAYSGAAFRKASSEVIIGCSGGGANAWAGNNITTLNLSQNVPAWNTKVNPTLANNIWNSSSAAGNPEKVFHRRMKDDSPMTWHTRWSNMFVDSLDTFLVFGGHNDWTLDAGSLDKVVDSWVYGAATWNQAVTYPDISGFTFGFSTTEQYFRVVDQSRNLVYFSVVDDLWKYTLATGVTANLQSSYAGVGTNFHNGHAIFDQTRDVILKFGAYQTVGGRLISIDANPASGTYKAITPLTFGGPAAAALGTSSAIGFVHDTVRDVYYFFNDNGSVYQGARNGATQIDISVFATTPFPADTYANPATGTANFSGSVWTRFIYAANIAGISGLIFVPNTGVNVFFLRTS